MVSALSPRRTVDAEAAAWVARLQSTHRDLATEAALKAWLNTSAAHREAFERATEIWALIPGAVAFDHNVDDRTSAGPAQSKRQSRHRTVAPAFALAASLLLIVGGLTWWMAHRPIAYVTGRGEQEVATLSDGSRVALDTDTALKVDYRPDARWITLDHGEAMFDVAHNTRRPFIVAAGDKRVRAVGTSFIVRRIDNKVEVTLLKGKVAVSEIGAPHNARPAKPTMLAPGERLIADNDTPPVIDTPPIDTVTAWRRGQIVFDRTPLAAALSELERYGGPEVTVPDPRLAATPVSGVFSTNDTAEFAMAIARLHGWRVVPDGAQFKIEQ
jgi:transmembrane sensor